jgi:hypothetical protein
MNWPESANYGQTFSPFLAISSFTELLRPLCTRNLGLVHAAENITEGTFIRETINNFHNVV